MDERAVQPLQDQWAIRSVGNELASCLDRFLTASADEGTLDKARDALTVWYRLTDQYAITLA
jgi:hypothetical protein